VLIATLICARPLNPFVAVCACTMAACGLLGLCDDYKKVKEKKSDGISSRTKLGWQLVIALIAASFIYFKPGDLRHRREPHRLQPATRASVREKQSIGIGAICFPVVQGPACRS
jgi:phospho-N-acetylmuramoyl-pentapeptide-transferase